MSTADLKQAFIEQVTETVRRLLESNHSSIIETMAEADAPKITVGISLKIRQTDGGYNVKAKIGYGVKRTDHAEVNVDDPSQEKLPL